MGGAKPDPRAGPRLVEMKFTFEIRPEELGQGERGHTFAIRVFRLGDQIELRLDVHGGPNKMDDVPLNFLEKIQAASETVRARVNLTDLVEPEG